MEATVLWVSSFPKGFRFLLSDETGRATLLLWADVYDRCTDKGALMEGAVVRVHGTVARYREEWQIEPRSCHEVEVLSPGSLPPERAIASIGPADRTTRATIQGTIVAVEPLGAGQRVILDDGSARIAVILWSSLLERIPQASQWVQTGTRIRVSGVIDQYRNQMELIPQLPVHVVVVD